MRVASKHAYICRDCGYIYNDRTLFDKLPDKYFCHGSHTYGVKIGGVVISTNDVSFPWLAICGVPKRRFRSYEPAVAKNANDTDVRKVRKEQIKRDEAIGRALPVVAVLLVVGLAALYFCLNNAF